MIYIDFDGVIYNTVKRLEEIAECEIVKFDLGNYGLDLSVFGLSDFYLKSEDYLIPRCVHYIKQLKKLDKVTILTKYCSEDEKNFKYDFIKNYLKIPRIKVIFVESNEDKQNYLNREDFLVDDQVDNLKEGSLYNVLFSSSGEFNVEWNEHKKGDYVTASSWSDVYKHIKFVDEIKRK